MATEDLAFGAGALPGVEPAGSRRKADMHLILARRMQAELAEQLPGAGDSTAPAAATRLTS
jgi:hypothetical protein